MTFLIVTMFFNFFIMSFLAMIWSSKWGFNFFFKFILFMNTLFNAVILYRLIFIGQI